MSAAYSMQGKTDIAKQVLQEGLKQVADDKPLQMAMASMFINRGNIDQAESIYKKIRYSGHISVGKLHY